MKWIKAKDKLPPDEFALQTFKSNGMNFTGWYHKEENVFEDIMAGKFPIEGIQWLDESEQDERWVPVSPKMEKPLCINGISPNLCDSIRKKEKMKPCSCLQYEEYLKTELNQEKGEVIAFHPSWIDPDFNPDGIRIGFINGEGKFWSAEWNDYQDTYQNNEEVMPTHYMRKPQPPATKD